MRHHYTLSILLVLFSQLLVNSFIYAGPKEDLKRYQDFFKNRFSELSLDDLSNGLYNFDKGRRDQWEDIMEFPPYEILVEEGEELFSRPFSNGKRYADCFDNSGIGIAHTYPRFNTKTGKVQNLSAAINECRVTNGEKALPYLKGEIVILLVYMADTSRGKKIDIQIPSDPRALAAYEDGKRIYFTRRGVRDFACYHCHWEAASKKIRGNVLSTAVGQATHFPAYRSKWGAAGSIQRRYKGCMKNVGAVPLKAQSNAMNNLEYFHTYMSNGISMNAPGSRF